MALRWWWMAALWVLVVVACVLWWRRRARRQRPSDDAVLVAHTAVLRRSPRYAELVRRRARTMLVQLAAVGLVLVGGLLLGSRVASVQVQSPDSHNRDIMLCLDASGSMASYDAAVTKEYTGIIDSLQGERIGLTLFSGTAVSIFPLSDDYAHVKDELAAASTAFGKNDYSYTAGVQGNDDRGSQIGDGLVSCMQRFDQPDQQRTRVVILASDNDIQGAPIYPLLQAAQMAKQAKVVVYGIGSPEMSMHSDQLAEFTQACQIASGAFFLLGDDKGGPAVVEGISQLEKTRLKGSPQVLTTDQPWIGGALVGVGLLVLLAMTLRRSR